MNQKKVFESAFLFLTISLMMLPFLITFNDILTKLVEKFFLYSFIQEKLVPIQALLVGLIVKPFVKDYTAYKDGLIINGLIMRITWNCIGWQSLLLFIFSLLIGLRGGSYTLLSRIEAITLGLLGIFWVNILRMSFTVILAAVALPIFKIVFHDYLAAIVTILYLFFFWWFAYRYILNIKNNNQLK